ncbi:MAG: metallophosphoesterase family protein [Promethearchaeota archaeon]
MKIIYTTDLHGIKWKYEKIQEQAIQQDVDMVINGGDMLPTQSDFFKQGDFIKEFLESHFQKYEEHSIYHLGILGNDDLKVFDTLFEDTCKKYSHVHNIAQKKVKIKDFEFIGMDLVTDLPFGLKDRARKDTPDFQFPRQIEKQYISTPNGLLRIENWFDHANSLPTIEKEMEKLIKPVNPDNSVYIIHMPPSHLGLDVCNDKRTIGSIAIYDFLKRSQPRLSLHGHIHESADVSKQWKNFINKTPCIQPGQSSSKEKHVIYVSIDLNTLECERVSCKREE